MNRQVEIRFAVSMVGGTSLAIHMNGTSQELFKMCQADKNDESAYGVALELMMADRAMVDVLSGTSAGGINAILLSAALANGTDLEITESVFEQMGDIDLLLRPANSKNPPSILQGDEVILRELESVFHKLLSGDNHPIAKWPLELFVTGTHLQGLPHIYRDSTNSPIHTLDYRGVFRFQQPAIWDKRNPRGDFREHKDENFDIVTASRRLARAGRTTSSLPAVFEPSEVLLSEFEVKEGPAILDVPSDVKVCWMGDGGYLNVRPLDLILEAVTRRASSGEKVIRKLVLVEPAPDPAREFDNERWPNGPDALEHLKLYGKISSSQSLKNVLADVARHNIQVSLLKDQFDYARAHASQEVFGQTEESENNVEPLYEKIKAIQAKELMPVRSIASSKRTESATDTTYDGVFRELLNLERWSLLAIDECYSTIDIAVVYSYQR